MLPSSVLGKTINRPANFRANREMNPEKYMVAYTRSIIIYIKKLFFQTTHIISRANRWKTNWFPRFVNDIFALWMRTPTKSMTHYTICAVLTLYLRGSSADLTDQFVSFLSWSFIYLPTWNQLFLIYFIQSPTYFNVKYNVRLNIFNKVSIFTVYISVHTFSIHFPSHMYCTIYSTRTCILYGFVRKYCPTR